MTGETFTISLRVWHPTERHQVIVQALGLKAEFAHTAGEPRTNPIGDRLEGVNKSTYCCFVLVAKQPGDFTEGIELLLPLLAPHRDYLRKLTYEGGRAELFVGVFVEGKSTGFTLGVSEMSVLADLSLELSVEFYY
jgi:hypothetical protein